MLASKPTKTGPRVYEELRRMAMEYQFKPNERINEVELAARMNVSRSPIREALQRLVTEGLITAQPNRGFFCRGFDADELLNLTDVRILLEERAVLLTILRASDAELRDLHDDWERTQARANALSDAELVTRDEDFHIRIARMSGNPEIANILKSINTRIHFVRRIGVERHEPRLRTYAEHTEIAAAMAARDSTRAIRLLHDHIRISAADAMATVKEGLARIYMREH